jgi:hypothetical protein
MARTPVSGSDDKFTSDKDGDSPNNQTVYRETGSSGQCEKTGEHYNPSTGKTYK